MSDSAGTIDELLAHSGWLRGLARSLVGDVVSLTEDSPVVSIARVQ